MISNCDKAKNTNLVHTEIRSKISVLGKAVKEGNAIEYQELNNIFLDQRTKLKKHFLKKR